MTSSGLSAAGVAEHYRRHCVHGPTVDRMLGLFFAVHPDRVPTGPADTDLLEDAFAWASRTLADDPDSGAATALAALGDLHGLREHTRDRARLLGLLDEAAVAFARAHGRRGVVYATGGVTADAVHLYSVPDGDQALTMPIGWALAYHATLA